MVEHGRQLGRTLGFPTLNVAWPDGKIVPAHGVYFCKIDVQDKTYPGIANVGIKPTVTEEKKLLIRVVSFWIFGKCIRRKKSGSV